MEVFTELRKKWWGRTESERKLAARNAINRSLRKIREQINEIEAQQNKTVTRLKEISKGNHQTLAQKRVDARVLGSSIVHSRKQVARLQTACAQLNSIKMQIDEQYAMRRIQMSMKDATGVMRSVNTLVQLPKLSDIMRKLNEELVASGVIEEMTGDMLLDPELDVADEATEAEVSKLVGEALGTEFVEEEPEPVPKEEMPSVPIEAHSVTAQSAGTEELARRMEGLKS